MGPMLRAVNEIARRLKSKYPHVAVDTLAYQYTQPAPNITRPEPNVIIRLCDISSNMGAPLTDPSNEAFAGIINDWFALTQRIYIWNYVVDFGDVLQSFPNYYVLGCGNHLFGVPFGTKCRSFYQDRLGANIGKLRQKVFLQPQHPVVCRPRCQGCLRGGPRRWRR